MPRRPRWLSLPRTRRGPRVIALLAFHNEMEFLPGYFNNVGPQVDGIVALDDGSTDGSGDFVARQGSVLELIRIPARRPHVWNEPANRKQIIAAAGRHEPDWVMAVDADERLEKTFRERARGDTLSTDLRALRVRARRERLCYRDDASLCTCAGDPSLTLRMTHRYVSARRVH